MALPLSKAAANIQKQITRLDEKAVNRLFPNSQRAQWPRGYLPAAGVAHFLNPAGVSFCDVLDCYRDMKEDHQYELQKDFAADYTLWCRCALEDHVASLDPRQRRRLRRLTARDRTARDSEIRQLFGLQPYCAPKALGTEAITKAKVTVAHGKGGEANTHGGPSGSSSTTPPSVLNTNRKSDPPPPPRGQGEGIFYEHTPYAATQQYAMLPVAEVQSPRQPVHFTTFPQIRNVLHTEFDSMSALRGLSLYSGDALVLSSELVQEVALYLRRRVAEIMADEEKFLNSASSSSSFVPSFSRETPVVCFFTNGRLPYLLAESGLLPFLVQPVQLPSQAAQRRQRYERMASKSPQQQQQQQQNPLHLLSDAGVLHDAFSTIFPCETLSVGDALRKYRPAVALVEPHVDRDWITDIRGYYSIREVILLGPVDSPAMGSFAFPFLSFGVTPGPTSYWTYNDNLQRVAGGASRVCMPMDPPHVAQGYDRRFIDDISAWMISPSDCAAIGSQFRCLSFVRKVCPVVKEKQSTDTP